MAAPLLLTSGPARCKAALHGFGTSSVCLFYAIATVFQLNPGGDMMYEIRRRKPEPTLFLTQRVFNLLHNIGMALEELAFDDVGYTQWGNGL